MMNLFQPAVKLQRKVRIGSRVTRVYDAPHTPWDRVLAGTDVDPACLLALQRLRQDIDPFALAQTIERKLTQIYRLASRSAAPVVKQPIGRGFRIRSAWAQVPPNGAQAPVIYDKMKARSVTPAHDSTGVRAQKPRSGAARATPCVTGGPG